MSFHAFEHKLLSHLRENYSSLEKVCVSCSYGEDSLALLEALKNLKPVINFKISVVHVHHGFSDDSKQIDYRDRALELTKDFCKENNLEFYFFKSEKKLKSEDDFREFRFESYSKLDEEVFFTGHQKQDHTETLLIKMIRGAGVESLKLGDLKTLEFKIFRPLLIFSKEEISEYALDKKLRPLKDPSNEDETYLRNWIRNLWLKDLENKRPGSLKSFSESLLKISKELNQRSKTDETRAFPISMETWTILSLIEKQNIIAKTLSEEKVLNYSSNQIIEVIKQLDSEKKEHIFKSAGLLWSKNKEEIAFKSL